MSAAANCGRSSLIVSLLSVRVNLDGNRCSPERLARNLHNNFLSRQRLVQTLLTALKTDRAAIELSH
jgi:hypothetical protein